ncbi:hypothetical protein DMENIID0001_051370 [Sergentomyia squamirostris]
MDSDSAPDDDGGNLPAVVGEMKKVCLRKAPSLGTNPTSHIIYTPSAVPAKPSGDKIIGTPTRAPLKSAPIKTSTDFMVNKNIFVKDGSLFMKCAKTNKIVKVQVAKTLPGGSGQLGELKILTPVNLKTLPQLKEVKLAPKPVVEATVTKMPPRIVSTAPPVTTSQSTYNFKPIATAPLTTPPQILAKPQPESTQTSSPTAPTPLPKDKTKVGGIQITNLPTGTILNFKGPSYNLNSVFPLMSRVEEKIPRDSRMINLQISNGRLSDPNGPIKMLGISGKSLTVARDSITLEDKSGIPDELSAMSSREKTPKKQIRSSSVDESPPRKSPTTRRLSEPVRDKDSLEDAPKLGSLFCNESLDISSDSERSIKSPQPKTPIVDPEILAMSDGYIDENERLLTPKNANCQLMKLNSRKEGEDEDPLNLIRWEDGVGYLYGSNLHFQFNEMGLVDIMDDDEYLRHQQSTETAYDRPIGERELNATRMRQLQGASKEPTYTCVGCMCFGSASDFLAPDYCSKVCLNASKTKATDGEVQRKEKKRKSGKDGKNFFPWREYLEATHCQKAPDELFQHCSPEIIEYYERNPFRAQMKLEAIDPDNCSVFGVATVLAVQGHRMLLHFDGSPVKYDFWLNFNSCDIFPARYSEHQGKNLIVPTAGKREKFVWRCYLEETKCEGAKVKNFRHLNVGGLVKQHGFEVKMKLEAENVKTTGKLTVATVADVIGNRLRIHFDGHTDQSDYWCDYDSPRLHPIDYHKIVDETLFSPVTPKRATFTWLRYLSQTRSFAAPYHVFPNRPPRGFQKGMKLEAVDRVCPEFIRPATVIDVIDYELRILYDGFETQYAYWVDDDSTDIFPTGYCEATGHPLEAVPSTRWVTQKCGLKVCGGRGSILHQMEKSHETATECPYNMKNYNHRAVKISRLNAAKKLITDYAIRFSLVRKRKINSHPVEEKRPPKSVSGSQKKPRKTAHSVDPPSSERKVAKLVPETVNPPSASTATTSAGTKSSEIETGGAGDVWMTTSLLLSKAEVDGKKRKNPLLWTTNEVSTFLTNLPHFSHIAEQFREHDINGEAFLSLSKDDLTKTLGIKLGPAIKLYNLIVKLRSDIKKQFMQF